MKIPDKIKIGGHWVNVVRVESFDGHDGMAGQAKHTKMEILLAEKCYGDEQAESNVAVGLLHEIVHHVDSLYQTGLKERQVDTLSEGLFQVLRDNELDFRLADKRAESRE